VLLRVFYGIFYGVFTVFKTFIGRWINLRLLLSYESFYKPLNFRIVNSPPPSGVGKHPAKRLKPAKRRRELETQKISGKNQPTKNYEKT